MRPDYIPSHRHSAIIAPSYRPTPEYDAVMRQKRRMLPAHHDLHSQSLRSLNISNACAYRQPEVLVYSQPEMRERGPYHGLGPSPGQYTPQVEVDILFDFFFQISCLFSTSHCFSVHFADQLQ